MAIKTSLIPLFYSLLISQLITAAATTTTTTADDDADPLDCHWTKPGDHQYQTITNNNNNNSSRLSDRCLVLRVFSRRQVERMADEQVDQLARDCACELGQMPWASVYDSDPAIRRLSAMVEATLARPKYQFQQPAYLWSDVELLVQGVSVFVSTRDYFQRRASGQLSMSVDTERSLRRELGFRSSQYVCAKLIYADRLNLFQYLENLQRLSAQVFFKLRAAHYVVRQIYEASRACKLLLVHKLSDFKLYPDNRDLVIVDAEHLDNLSLRDRPFEEAVELVNEIEHQHQQRQQLVGHNDDNHAAGSSNMNQINSMAYQKINATTTTTTTIANVAGVPSDTQTSGRDIDRELKHMSLHLINCKSFARRRPGATSKWTHAQLSDECPMMLDDMLPVNWTLRRYPDELLRSQRILACACQLLLHGDTFARVMQLDELQLMSRTLSQYLNERKSPAFNEVPLWSLYGWFQEVMEELVSKGRNAMLARLIRVEARTTTSTSSLKNSTTTSNHVEDASEPTGAAPRLLLVDKYKKQCLEMARRACNILLFNHSKLLSQAEKQDMALIRHLDNLRFLAKDPMFVFHLTLQDANLFKLYAMSKMCPPIIA